MDSIIDNLKNENIWKEYLEFKKSQYSMKEYEILQIEEYINKKKYLDIVTKIINGNYKFSIPKKHLINKINTSKKRIVYTFEEDETMVLKLLTFLFSKKYDEKYISNCYSFRKKYTVKDAIRKLAHTKKINEMYGYKVDVSNYFNSANTEILLKKLKIFLADDTKLFNMLESILIDDRVDFNNTIIKENKGMMAGVPISAFLANIYLQEIDDYFEKENVLYIRYSDDIIFFTEEENLQKYVKKLNEYIANNKLCLNPDKIQYIKPHNKWDFLGFSYHDGKIDISEITKKKIKGKIRRSSRKLRRWSIKKNASYERAIAAVIRKFNKKFYMIENKNELTWQLWYFPVINTADGIHEIDLYMQECLRYIKTGKHNKKNYNLKYDELKQLGYRPLVSEYYKFKERT